MLEIKFRSGDSRIAGIEGGAYRPAHITRVQVQRRGVLQRHDLNRIAEEIRDVFLKRTDAEEAAGSSIIFQG